MRDFLIGFGRIMIVLGAIKLMRVWIRDGKEMDHAED